MCHSLTIAFPMGWQAPFDDDDLIPVYGFGDSTTHDTDVFSFNKRGWYNTLREGHVLTRHMVTPTLLPHTLAQRNHSMASPRLSRGTEILSVVSSCQVRDCTAAAATVQGRGDCASPLTGVWTPPVCGIVQARPALLPSSTKQHRLLVPVASTTFL